MLDSGAQVSAIYAKILDFAGDTLFGDHAAKTRAIMDTIIYSKTNDYKFESEYRLAIPLGGAAFFLCGSGHQFL
jgi:hypothetical protein